MNRHHLTRREFLQTGAAGVALAAAAPASLLAAGEYGGNKIPIGIQLWSVHNECAKDLPGTFSALGKMGYKAVEFADYFGHDAKSLRKILDDAGLKCCGTHIYLETLLGDELPKSIEFNSILGNSHFVVRMLSPKYMASLKGYEQAADLCSEVAENLKPHGMHIGYHNHESEFKPFKGGQLPWDVFFNRAKADVFIQLDTANAASGGADPVVFLKKFPGRVASVHVKGFSKTKPGALIGQDDLRWKEIFSICETTAGTQWYIIEYESDLYPPMVAVEKTLEIMRRWGKC